MNTKKRGPAPGTKYNGTDLNSFGKALFAARRKKGYTQEELGKLIGTNKRMICYFERQSQNPTLETIKKLAEVLDVSPETLVAGPNAQTPEPRAIRSLQKKLAIVHQLPPEDQRYIAKMIDLVAEKHGIETQ